MRQLPLGVRLRADAIFDSFVPGSNTELLAALRGEGRAPLWLWGARGTGKTHLLQAACSAAAESAAYCPLDLQAGLPPDALAGFENCRLVCVDDVEAVSGNSAGEQALFRFFNDAMEAGTRLIFAATAAPRALHWRLEDWRSRAAACVVYQVRELNEPGRAEALRLRAAQRGLVLPAETTEYLLRRMPRDLPMLFEILDHLDEASLIAQRRLTVPFIRAVLAKFSETKP